jgi:hypothetical protein
MSDYDIDLSLWSEQQAALLRRRAAGELINEAELDWYNIAEEIESVGGNTRRELRNRLARLLQHLLKWHYQPEHRSRSTAAGAGRLLDCKRRGLRQIEQPGLLQRIGPGAWPCSFEQFRKLGLQRRIVRQQILDLPALRANGGTAGRSAGRLRHLKAISPRVPEERYQIGWWKSAAPQQTPACRTRGSTPLQPAQHPQPPCRE